MTRSKAFLGETNDRDKALAGIASLELTITQDSFGQYTSHTSQRVWRFTKSNIPPQLACANPRCQQGGLDLQRIALFLPAGEHSYWCNGHEGSPTGRRRGDPCDNRFDLLISITREPE